MPLLVDVTLVRGIVVCSRLLTSWFLVGSSSIKLLVAPVSATTGAFVAVSCLTFDDNGDIGHLL